MTKHWTDAEVEAVRRNYESHGLQMQEWDEPIERSPLAVRHKANKLGLTVREPYRDRTKWTSREEGVLRRNYPLYGTSVDLWDEPIEKSARNIQSKAQYLGLRMRGCHRLSKDESERLARACALIAERLGITSGELVREICVMERSGLL